MQTGQQTSTALAVVTPQQRAMQAQTLRPPLAFSDVERATIRDAFMPGATEAEARALIAVAEHMRIDPFKRQIHFVKRWTRGEDGGPGREAWAFQTAIDGFRSLAEDTGEFLGSDEPVFTFEETVNPATGEPTGKKELVARVRVHRRGFEQSFVGVARYTEFVQTKRDGTPNAMWAKAPRNMLAKCAEAQALRKAFPQNLAGVYTDDELPPRDVSPALAPADAQPLLPATPAVVDAEVVPGIDWPAKYGACAALAELAAVDAEAQAAKLAGATRAAALAARKTKKTEIDAAAAKPAPAAAQPEPQVDPITGEVVPPPSDEPGSDG